MNAKTPHTGGASNNQPQSTLAHFAGPGADWPPMLAAMLPQRLKQIDGHPGTYLLTAGRGRPTCDVCKHRVRADLYDGSTLHEAKPTRDITILARLCRDCANSAGIPEMAVMLP